MSPKYYFNLNLSTTATLHGDRRKWPLWRGGRCREVETRLNVWIVRQKKWRCRGVAVVNRWPLEELGV